tara:strand:+ start:2804 stop:3034 length:231 start_codon:yes stop_codon:yes gene_type:complete
MAKKKTVKGKRKNLLKTDPEQKPNISYEQKMGADPTISGFIKPEKKEIKEEAKPKAYVTSRPKTAFNTRKRYDQTN